MPRSPRHRTAFLSLTAADMLKPCGPLPVCTAVPRGQTALTRMTMNRSAGCPTRCVRVCFSDLMARRWRGLSRRPAWEGSPRTCCSPKPTCAGCLTVSSAGRQSARRWRPVTPMAPLSSAPLRTPLRWLTSLTGQRDKKMLFCQPDKNRQIGYGTACPLWTSSARSSA